MYIKALKYYKANDFVDAKEEFRQVDARIPGYEFTDKYLSEIDQALTGKPAVIVPPPVAVVSPISAPAVVVTAAPVVDDSRQKELEYERQRVQELKDKTDQAQEIYVMALKSYREHQWEISKAQFESVEQIIPDYKHTHRYLEKIEDRMARTASSVNPVVVVSPVAVVTPAPVVVAPAPVESSMPAEVKVAISLEDQQKQAQDIAALAMKSAELYRQIADVADDQTTVQTKKKMAQVDEILKNLKENKERLLRQMQEDQWRQQQEESKARQEEQRAQTEKMYQDAVEYLRSHEYAKAKIKFLELENKIPDYKATRRYLSRIDKDLQQANAQAITVHEQEEALHLKQLQDKEDAAQWRQSQEEQEKQRQIQQQQQAALGQLAQKASDINDDIIRLSKQQDYEAMKEKFAELENTVTALTTLKDEMAKQKDRTEREKQLTDENIRQRNEELAAQKREDQQIHAYYSAEPLKEYRPELSDQPDGAADQYRRREIMQEQNTLFSEGVDRFEHKKYSQAKLLFGELADQHDRRAEVWLKKVDRAITRELLKSQEGEERERTAFIADQLKAQRELIIIQERERQRQKKLTEELERQKRLYEDDRLFQLRKEETMKIQERERERQEEKRLRLEKENEKQQEMMRFHKIVIVIKPQSVAVPQHPVVISPIPSPAAPAISPKQLRAQIDFSNKRKAFLDNKYRKEQKEQARQARIKADAEARQKRIEEKQKEKARREEERQARMKAEAEAREKIKEQRQREEEHQEELKAQREEEREARIKAEADAKAQQAQAQAERLAQEEKHKEEVLREQEEQRQEKMKQEEIIRQEAQHREELEQEERQRQAQLQAQREAVRKQLEDGVEAMYQDALSLYNQGEYTAAADRFKDVQDILPGYKRAEQYMNEARQKSLNVKPQAVTIAAPSASAGSSTPVSRQDDVTKALDLFDPNAK